MALTSASERQATSARLAERAAVQAGGTSSIAAAQRVVAQYQATNASLAQVAIASMLAEQAISSTPDALLNPLAFTTGAEMFAQMLESAGAPGFDRLVKSLVQSSGRVAESVSVAARADIGWVRTLNLPSCSRCVVLAGRVYRYSEKFDRHVNDDCSLTAVREGDTTFTEDPLELARKGLVRGLSKADFEALEEGADYNRVVNVRRKAAGLTSAGRVLARANKLTPEGIYQLASDRNDALRLLRRYGYLLSS